MPAFLPSVSYFPDGASHISTTSSSDEPRSVGQAATPQSSLVVCVCAYPVSSAEDMRWRSAPSHCHFLQGEDACVYGVWFPPTCSVEERVTASCRSVINPPRVAASWQVDIELHLILATKADLRECWSQFKKPEFVHTGSAWISLEGLEIQSCVFKTWNSTCFHIE